MQIKKDDEILFLKEKISVLESKLSNDEINDVLLKFEKGFCGVFVKSKSENINLNKIKDNLNLVIISNSQLADRGIKTLIKYGNANFYHNIDLANLSGRMDHLF